MSPWPNRLGEPTVVRNVEGTQITFDEVGTPLLTLQNRPDFGTTWVLFYLESDDEAAGTEEHITGARAEDIDGALYSARRHLRLLHHAHWDAWWKRVHQCVDMALGLTQPIPATDDDRAAFENGDDPDDWAESEVVRRIQTERSN